MLIHRRLDDLLAWAGEVDRTANPLEAELFGAGIRGSMCDPWRDVVEDPDAVLGAELVRAVQEAGRPEASALLACVEAAWPEPVSSWARAAAVRLERSGLRRPTWVGALGALVLERVAVAEDPYGDVAVAVATFSYGGERRHNAVVLLDRLDGGRTADALIGVQPDEDAVARSLAGARGPFADLGPLRPVDSRQAAALLRQGLAAWRAIGSGVADVKKGGDDAGRAPLSLLETRLRLFPPLGRRERLAVPSPLECERMVLEYQESPEADDLEVEPDGLDFLAWNVVEFKVRHGDGDPLRWSPRLVELFMGEFFPRKVTADDGIAGHLPAVLSGWIRWAGRRRGLDPELVRGTLAAVDGSRQAFQKACRDHSRYLFRRPAASAARTSTYVIAALTTSSVDSQRSRASW
jgi:hypothetical protein